MVESFFCGRNLLISHEQWRKGFDGRTINMKNCKQILLRERERMRKLVLEKEAKKQLVNLFVCFRFFINNLVLESSFINKIVSRCHVTAILTNNGRGQQTTVIVK